MCDIKKGRPRDGLSVKKIRTVRLNAEDHEYIKSKGGLAKFIKTAIRAAKEGMYEEMERDARVEKGCD